MPNDVVLCCEPSCTAHQDLLEGVCTKLVSSLKAAAESSIPCSGQRRRTGVAGWLQFVKPELEASRWWYKLWIDAGSPSAGVLFSRKSMPIEDISMLSIV